MRFILAFVFTAVIIILVLLLDPDHGHITERHGEKPPSVETTRTTIAPTKKSVTPKADTVPVEVAAPNSEEPVTTPKPDQRP